MLIREIEDQVEKFLKNSKFHLLFIWGPRRSGKTTLLEKLSRQYKTPVFNFDLLSDREKFQPRQEILDKLVAEHRVILIDEVQNAPEATVVLKILADNYKVKIIATGSSELRQKAGVDWDSLADRFEEAYCLPLSTAEIVNNAGLKNMSWSVLVKICPSGCSFSAVIRKFTPAICPRRGKWPNWRGLSTLMC